MENQKCNRFVGAIIALGFTGQQITRFHAPPYRAENGDLGNFEAVDRNGTAFAPKECLLQKVATCMENLKMEPLCQCNKRTGHYGLANHPLSCTA